MTIAVQDAAERIRAKIARGAAATTAPAGEAAPPQAQAAAPAQDDDGSRAAARIRARIETRRPTPDADAGAALAIAPAPAAAAAPGSGEVFPDSYELPPVTTKHPPASFPAAAPDATSDDVKWRPISDMFFNQLSTLGIRDPVQSAMEAVPVGDLRDNASRLTRALGDGIVWGGPAASPDWRNEKKLQTLGGWLNEDGYIDPARMDALAERDPGIKKALTGLRTLQAISVEEAAKRTPEQIQENQLALLAEIRELLNSDNPEDREYLSDEHGITQIGMADLDYRAVMKLGFPGVHYPAMTDGEVSEQLTEGMRAHASNELQVWQHDHWMAATTASVLGGSAVFIPVMRGISLVGRLAGIGRIAGAGRIGARLRMLNEGVAFGGADLVVQGLQKKFGARDDVDLTQSLIMGGTGALANVVTELAYMSGLQRMAAKIAKEVTSKGIVPSPIAVEMLAAAHMAKDRGWKLGLGALNMSSQQLMATTINYARARIEQLQSGGTIKAPDVDWAVEGFTLLLNGLVGMADGFVSGNKYRLEVGERLTEEARAKALARLKKSPLVTGDAAAKPGPDVTFGEAQDLADQSNESRVSHEKAAPPGEPGVSEPGVSPRTETGDGTPDVLAEIDAAAAADSPTAGGEAQPKVFDVGADLSASDRVRIGNGAVVEKTIAPYFNMPGGRSTVERTAVSRLQVKPEMMQFKQGYGEGGVVAGERLTGDYAHEPARPLFIWERIDGTLIVVDGHHRYELAVRTGTEEVATNTVREADGWTLERVRARGAIANIRDGAGTVRDYARFFKNSTFITEASARQQGLLGKAKGQQGWAIGRGAGKFLFEKVINEGISDTVASAISETLPARDSNSETAQDSAVKKAIEGKWPADRARSYAQQLAEIIGAAEKKASQKDMFGNSEGDKKALENAERISEQIAAMRSEASEKIRSTEGAAHNPEEAAKFGLKFDTEQQRKQVLADLKVLKRRHADLGEAHKFPELMDEARERAGLPPKEGFEDVRAARHKGAERAASGEPAPGGLFGAKKVEAPVATVKPAVSPRAAAILKAHGNDAAAAIDHLRGKVSETPRGSAADADLRSLIQEIENSRPPVQPAKADGQGAVTGKPASVISDETRAGLKKQAEDAAPGIAARAAHRKELIAGKAPPKPDPTPAQSSFRTLVGGDDPKNDPTYARVADRFEQVASAADSRARRVQQALDSATTLMSRDGHDPSEIPHQSDMAPDLASLHAARQGLLGGVSRWMKGRKPTKPGAKLVTKEAAAKLAAREAADVKQVDELLAKVDEASARVVTRLANDGRLEPANADTNTRPGAKPDEAAAELSALNSELNIASGRAHDASAAKAAFAEDTVKKLEAELRALEKAETTMRIAAVAGKNETGKQVLARLGVSSKAEANARYEAVQQAIKAKGAERDAARQRLDELEAADVAANEKWVAATAKRDAAIAKVKADGGQRSGAPDAAANAGEVVDQPLADRLAAKSVKVPDRIAKLVVNIGRQRSGVDTTTLNVDQLRDVDSLSQSGEVDYIYDRAGRERILDSRFPTPRGWRRENEQFATTASPKQVEAAKIARSAVDSGSDTSGVVIDGAGETLDGEAASLMASRIADGTLQVRDSRKIGKEQGSYEVTLKDGTKISFLIGDDAVRHLYEDYHTKLQMDARRAKEGGQLALPSFRSYMSKELRAQLDAQHRRFVQSVVFGAGRKVISLGVRAIGATINAFNLRGNTNWGREMQLGFERGLGWYADPKLEKLAREYDQALAIADRRIGETIRDLERIVRATPNGEYLMHDAFWALEGKPPQEWVPAEPGGRRSPRTKDMNPAPLKGELRPRTTVIKYDRQAAVAMARVIERVRDQFAEAGEKLVNMGRMAEEVRLEGDIDPFTGERMVTIYYKGDVPEQHLRGGELIGGFNFYKGKYAPHLVKRAYAATFAEHAARLGELGVPLFSQTHNRQAEESYLKQRKLTADEWLRLGGIADFRRVIPTLRHQMRLGAELEFQRKVYEDGGMLVHNQLPSMRLLDDQVVTTKEAIKAHLKWMTKHRIRVNQEIPVDAQMTVRRSRLERKAMQIEQLFDEGGLPEHGLPNGWAPGDDASKTLMGMQNDLRRLRRGLWQVTNLDQPLGAVPAAVAGANLQLRALNDRLAALQLQKKQGWQELEGTGWGALNEYGRRPTWMRGDVFHSQAARAEETAAWGALWNSVLGHAKAAVTNENAVTQLANFTGNFGLNHGVGMNAWWFPYYYSHAYKALHELKSTGAVTNQTAADWIADGGFDMDRINATTLPDVQKTFGEWMAEPGARAERRGEKGGSVATAVFINQIVNVMSYIKEDAPVVSSGFAAARGSYTFSDQVSELALYLAARSGKGFTRGELDRETAGRLVSDHYNQRDIPPFLRGKLGRGGLLPFASWIYKNISAIPRHAMLRDATSLWADIPARIAALPFSGQTAKNVRSGFATGLSLAGLAARYVGYHALAHLAGRNMAGMTEEEYDKALDQRSRGSALKKMMLLPIWFDKDEVADPSKRVAFIDLSGMTALGQIMKMGQNAPNPADDWVMTVARMNPLGSAAVDYARNTDYYGKQLGQPDEAGKQGTRNRFYQGVIRPFVPGTIRSFAEMDWNEHPGFDGVARALGIRIERGDANLLTQALTYQAAKEGKHVKWVTSLMALDLEGKLMLKEYDIARIITKAQRAFESGDIKSYAQFAAWIQAELKADAGSK